MSNQELVIAGKAWELSVEVNGISMVLAGLSNQLESKESDTLTVPALMEAIYAIRKHLERVATDLENIGA